MAQSKPIFGENDIWASSASLVNKQKPNQPKIGSGWQYGEKPPHNEFNWWWELVGQMLIHIQERGTMEWENRTVYFKGSIVYYNNELWKSKQNTNNDNVPQDPSVWWGILVTQEEIVTN